MVQEIEAGGELDEPEAGAEDDNEGVHRVHRQDPDRQEGPEDVAGADEREVREAGRRVLGDGEAGGAAEVRAV